MFTKTTQPQTIPFELTPDQIAEDIEAICLNEEQRNKLYLCLDNKPPQEQEFSKVNEFLQKADNMEEARDKFDKLIKEVEKFIKDINSKVKDIQSRVEFLSSPEFDDCFAQLSINK